MLTTIQALFYASRGIASDVVRAQAWLTNRPRPAWSEIPTHAAIALPSLDPRYPETWDKYEAVGDGIEMRLCYTIRQLDGGDGLLCRIPVLIPDVEKARRFLDWQVGGSYAWAEIADIFDETLTPEIFHAAVRRPPHAAICSELQRAGLVTAGRRFVAPHLLCTPQDELLIVRRLNADHFQMTGERAGPEYWPGKDRSL